MKQKETWNCCCLRIFYPVAGEILNQLSIALGLAPPCTEVGIYVDGQPAAQTWADAGGHWQVSMHLPLKDGTHNLNVFSGGCKEQTEFTIGRGTTPVPPPSITWPGPVIEDQSPLVQGSARPGDSVRICVDAQTCGTVTADQNGDFHWQYTGILEEGLHIVTAVASDSDGRESSVTYQIFHYQIHQDFSVALESAQEGNDFRTVGLKLAVTGTVYPVTLYYLLLPPGSPAPSVDEIRNYTGPGLAEGTAAAGSILIDGSGNQTIDVSGLENALPGALGLVDGYRYDVYLAADNGMEQSPVLSALKVRAMPFAGGKGTEAEPYRIRELGRDEIARNYPDLSAGQSPLGVDDTARLLRNIERMGLLFQESAGARGVRDSMGLNYQLTTSLSLAGYAAADDGQGWTALGYKDEDTFPTAFTGSLTGIGRETPVRGLTIRRDSAHRQEGLFAYAKSACFKDLALENPSIVIDSSRDLINGTVWMGTLAAWMYSGILDGIILSGAHLSLTGSDWIDPLVGGLIGAAVGDVNANGLIGENLQIVNTIITDWNEGNTGGLFGILAYEDGGSPSVRDVTVNAAAVKGDDTVGGMVGWAKEFQALRSVTVQNSSVTGRYAVAGLAGDLRQRRENGEGLIEAVISRGNTVMAEASYAGGIAAYLDVESLNVQASEVSDCTIQSDEGDYGGFLGYIRTHGPVTFSQCSVTDCRIIGVKGNFSVAGFAGTVENEQEEPQFLSCMVRDTEINVEGDGYRIAGFIGYLLGYQGGRFDQCHVTGGGIRSSTSDRAGGFAGEIVLERRAAISFTSCSVKLQEGVNCNNYGGGFIGRMDSYEDNDIRLEDCICQSDIHCQNQYAGGFIGRCNQGIFTRCRASGEVNARDYAGGFIGMSDGNEAYGGYGIQFLQCAASGMVRQDLENTSESAGGFGSGFSQTSLKECFFSGQIRSAAMESGGLSGRLSGNCLVEDCYVSGEFTSTGDCAGGIFGIILDGGVTVNRCYCQSTITGGSNTGGIGGKCENDGESVIENSLVLAPSISGRRPTRRVIGDGGEGLTLHENYAATTQVFEDQAQKPLEDDPDGWDGGSITWDQIITVMRNGGWPDTIWDYNSVTEGNGPKLLKNPETV